MKDTKDVSCCVIDNGGSYFSLAQRLTKEYKTVFYTNPSWVDPYPLMNKAYIGYGYDELEVVSSPFEIYDQVNLWIFPVSETLKV